MKRWLALTMMTFGVVHAQDDSPEEPIVRVDTEPDSVAVGEAIRMRVTVLVPTWFPRPPEYPDFELANTVTRLPADSSFPTSERIGAVTWSGIIRDYRVYPLAAATYRMAGETIAVTYANPGAEPIETEVPVPDAEFRATVPAGAESLDPYLAGRRLTLKLEVDGSTDGLVSGDAVVLRYTAELDGLPAIFLPPLAPTLDLAGVSSYADQPEVSDGPPARRSEKLTLVFNSGGEFTVPPVELAYWNTATTSVDTASTDAVTLTVAGPPAAPEAVSEPAAIDWRQVLAIVAAVAVLGLLLIVVVRRIWPRLHEALEGAARRRRESEAHAFRQLESELQAGRSREAYLRLLEWTERLQPPIDSRELAGRYGDERLQAAVETWHAGLFGSHSGGGDLKSLAAGLAAARERYRDRSRTAAAYRLPPLNPAREAADERRTLP